MTSFKFFYEKINYRCANINQYGLPKEKFGGNIIREKGCGDDQKCQNDDKAFVILQIFQAGDGDFREHESCENTCLDEQGAFGPEHRPLVIAAEIFHDIKAEDIHAHCGSWEAEESGILSGVEVEFCESPEGGCGD